MTDRRDRAITFDLDNTLVHNAFEGWVIPEITARLAGGRPRADVARSLLERHRRALDSGDPLGAYNWQAHADALAAETGLPAGTVDVAEVVRKHAVPGRVGLLDDDTPAVLRGLREAGWRVTVLTNGFRVYQEPVMRATGLWHAVDEVITTDDIGYAKPDRRAFAAAHQGARHTVHVGDRIDHDVRGARLAEVSSVLIQQGSPVTGLTTAMDAAQRTALREFILTVARSQRMTLDAVSDDMVPDAVVTEAAGLPGVLHQLGELDGKEVTTS